jgi:hypothetical protein
LNEHTDIDPSGSKTTSILPSSQNLSNQKNANHPLANADGSIIWELHILAQNAQPEKTTDSKSNSGNLNKHKLLNRKTTPNKQTESQI